MTRLQTNQMNTTAARCPRFMSLVHVPALCSVPYLRFMSCFMYLLHGHAYVLLCVARLLAMAVAIFPLHAPLLCPRFMSRFMSLLHVPASCPLVCCKITHHGRCHIPRFMAPLQVPVSCSHFMSLLQVPLCVARLRALTVDDVRVLLKECGPHWYTIAEYIYTLK